MSNNNETPCGLPQPTPVRLIEELKRKNDVYAEARRQAAINTAAVCENMTKIQKELQMKGGEQ